MQIIEVDFEYIHSPSNENPFEKVPKGLPYSILKKMAVPIIGKIRSKMDGKTLDITTQPIQQYKATLKGYKDRDVNIRLFSTKSEISNRPCILYLHGGCWINGDIDTSKNFCKALAESTDAVVIYVDYGLAPENPYPSALMDIYEVLKWAHSSYQKLNIDPTKISLVGDNSGGNLASVISMMARDEKKIKIYRQVLISPIVKVSEDGITCPEDDASMAMLLKMFSQWYLNDQPIWNNPSISPILGNLSNLPKTMVVVCDLDNMKHEQMQFAKNIYDNNNDVVCYKYNNTKYGFVDYIGYMPQAKKICKQISYFLN